MSNASKIILFVFLLIISCCTIMYVACDKKPELHTSTYMIYSEMNTSWTDKEVADRFGPPTIIYDWAKEPDYNFKSTLDIIVGSNQYQTINRINPHKGKEYMYYDVVFHRIFHVCINDEGKVTEKFIERSYQ